MSTVAKVVRGTGDVTLNGVHIVSAIQVIGGTAVASIYNDTTAVAANKIGEVTVAAGGVWWDPQTPVRVENLFFDAGIGVTEVFIHLV
jgi:hypothetical protein